MEIRERCLMTGKVIFDTIEDAEGFVRAMKRRGDGRVQKVVPGACPFCHGRHVSSGKRDGRVRGR